MKILVVEDEQQIASFVQKGLSEQGFSVDVSMDGNEGFEMGTSREYDAMVLDIMLPGRDGISILSELRSNGIECPVILLTARNALEDRVRGLDCGADDYLTKPFFVEELVARLHAITRRGGATSVVSHKGVALDRVKRQVQVGEQHLELTSREFNLLEYLMRNPGNVYTRTQILEYVWEYHFDPKTNIVDVYIQRLRSKLADLGANDFIETVRGVGYRVRNGEPVAHS